MFDFTGCVVNKDFALEELKALPKKAKLVVTVDAFHVLEVFSFPETLFVTASLKPSFETVLYEILKKRWPTMDLGSMMEELRRTLNNIQIEDGLPSSLRFQKLQVEDSA